MAEEFEGMPGIVAIRIDDRLIHGQVVAYWSNSLKLTRIMVANDDVAVDDMRKSVLRMAAPAGIKTSIIPVERAAKQILEGKYAGQRVFLIVNKPAGLSVDGPDDDTLLNRALLYLNQQGEYKENDLYTPALCHRLDTGTSGLVIIAKTPEAEELFLSAIKNREVQKTYLCVTFGRPMPPDATLGGYLLKDADRGIVKIVEDKQPGAKEVETRYETIAVSGRLALLKVQLITGRTHQIRAHMASIGCPILGDSKYGNNSANRELKLKYQALCAWELTMPRFTQPDFAFLSGKTFHAPKPWYYQQVLDGTLK